MSKLNHSIKQRNKKIAKIRYGTPLNITKFLKEDQKIYESRKEGILGKKRKKYRLIDLFAGAGGMSLGFSKIFGHLFEPVWANDFNEDCVKTYNENFGNHCILGDINQILQSASITIPQADVGIGGPP